MEILNKILKRFGYIKVNMPSDIKVPLSDIYRKNGIWYNVYDSITEDNLSEEKKKEIEREHEIYFRLAPAEYLRLQAFLKNHRHSEDKRFFEGPHHWIGFGSGGGIGKCVYVKCEHCGEVYDITDNSVW